MLLLFTEKASALYKANKNPFAGCFQSRNCRWSLQEPKSAKKGKKDAASVAVNGAAAPGDVAAGALVNGRVVKAEGAGVVIALPGRQVTGGPGAWKGYSIQALTQPVLNRTSVAFVHTAVYRFYGIHRSTGFGSQAGRAALMQLHDVWVEDALAGLKEGTFVRARVLEAPPGGKATLSLRPSQVGAMGFVLPGVRCGDWVV